MVIKDSDLIHEEYSHNPRPFWFWVILLSLLILTILGLQGALQSILDRKLRESPFTEVTNREFSLFLWENSQWMRVHAKDKVGYLPAFQLLGAVSVEPELAEEIVVAPPPLLFLYHTWHRLLSSRSIPREIYLSEFLQFLSEVEEWKPEYWKNAPPNYVALLAAKDKITGDEDLYSRLPLPIQKAFIGWKNYKKEGEKIIAFSPTINQVVDFLKKYPHYSRNYWKNIISENYLKVLLEKKEGDELISVDELAPFFKQALYNFSTSTRSRH